MSDFCQQCSEESFAEDFGDLSGLISQVDWDKGLAADVLCEGCGPCQVDPKGKCISYCQEDHYLDSLPDPE